MHARHAKLIAWSAQRLWKCCRTLKWIHLLTLGRLCYLYVITLFSVQSGMLEYNTFTCYVWVGISVCTAACKCSLCSQECWRTIHSTVMSGQALAFAQVLALFSMQSGMLECNSFTWYVWASSSICTGACIVLCAVRNVGVQYIHLLCLGRLQYLHRCLHCSLCSQECWCTIHPPAMSGQAPVFAKVIALFSVQSGMLEYNTSTCYV